LIGLEGALGPIKVLHVGMGPIGAAIARQVASRRTCSIGGAVDRDPALVGRDVGEVAGLRRRLAIKVGGDLAAALRSVQPDVAVVSTSSNLGDVVTTLETILRAKVPIVSTTEELVYPVKGRAALAKRIDAAARRARVAVLATGVNPGFVMDALPIALSAVCESVTSVEVDRVQDARIRRGPFQRKIGAGLSAEAFAAAAKAGTVRHVGLAESITMIADALGWKLDRITDDVYPKIAGEPVSGGDVPIETGDISGIVQDGVGYRKGKALIRLHMEAYLGAPESYDAIRIAGSPPLSVKFAGGVHGDIATASIVVNSLPRVMAAPPGLRTMRDMPLPSFLGGR
jgi:4-hydroxy-tetrahydrodipicolinate reductase